MDEDTPTRAYTLGLFVADGWIERRGKSFYISCTDRQIIVDVAEAVDFTNKIVIGKAGWGSNKTGKMYRLGFAGRPLEQIKAMGFTADKTGGEFIPNTVSDTTLHHFLRGLTDGDGTWGVVAGKYLSWGMISASESFLVLLLDRLRGLRVIRASGVQVKPRPSTNGVVYRIRLGHEDSVALGDFMYQGTNLMLHRKHDIYMAHRDLNLKIHRWTPEELEMALSGVCPPGRSRSAYHAKRWEMRRAAHQSTVSGCTEVRALTRAGTL